MAALNGETLDGHRTADDIRAIVDSIKIEHAVNSNFQFADLFTGGPSQHFRRIILGVSSQFFQQIGGCNAGQSLPISPPLLKEHVHPHPHNILTHVCA